MRSKVTQVCSRIYVQTWYTEIMADNPEDIGNLPLESFQPKHIAFPSRSFCKSAHVHRLFQTTWFNDFASLVPRPSTRGVADGSGNETINCVAALRRIVLLYVMFTDQGQLLYYCVCIMDCLETGYYLGSDGSRFNLKSM